MSKFHSIKWMDPGLVSMIDQRKLPHEVVYNEYKDPESIAGAIKDMVIRGAPAIGAAAAFGLALVPWHDNSGDLQVVVAEVERASEILAASRPTAVNLFWAIDRMMKLVREESFSNVAELRDSLLGEAQVIADEDAEINLTICKNAQQLIPEGAVIFHHCNTGSLAAVDYGTALGIIRLAHEEGKNVFAYVDETRPRLQGARLTAWEDRKSVV